MTAAPDRAPAICVLSIKPRDAVMTCQSLATAGIQAFAVVSFDELVSALQAPLGALMITEEAVPAKGWGQLAAALHDQPPWSDVPAIVFSRQRQPGLEKLLESGTGNITVVETPVRVSTVVSAAQVALRARKRQYEVRDLLVRLEDADRRKDEFLAMLGHELRNPLGAIQLAIQVKQRLDPALADDRQMQIMARQLGNLGRILDDLLDVSRVTLGKIQLSRTHVDLVDTARRCVQALANDAVQSGLELRVHAPEQALWVSGDPVRIEQVMSNLVTNAIKYTPRGGSIDVAVERVDDRVRVTVKDTGIGIKPELLPQLFELFIQAEQGLDRSRGGLGLGLALVRRLVELHDGKVSAHSDGPGRGATFWFELPHHVPRQVVTRPAVTSVRPLRVLLVEDNDDARELLSELLANDGHEVFVACDGAEGLTSTVDHAPDVMLVDIGLPKLDGHELAREVRRTVSHRPWMVAMTGYGQPTDRERALAAGFDMFVVKPVAFVDIQNALAAAPR